MSLARRACFVLYTPIKSHVLATWDIRSQNHGRTFPLRNLLLGALMWSCPIEILHLGMHDMMELLLMQDHYVVQALSPHTPQKAFTDRMGASGVTGPRLPK